MAGAQQIGGFGVIATAGILVADHQGDGGAGGVSLVYAGQKFHGVGFGTGGGKSVAAGTASVHGGSNGRFIHRQAGGQTVQHGTHGGAVAFAEDGQADRIAKGVFHSKRILSQEE